MWRYQEALDLLRPGARPCPPAEQRLKALLERVVLEHPKVGAPRAPSAVSVPGTRPYAFYTTSFGRGAAHGSDAEDTEERSHPQTNVVCVCSGNHYKKERSRFLMPFPARSVGECIYGVCGPRISNNPGKPNPNPNRKLTQGRQESPWVRVEGRRSILFRIPFVWKMWEFRTFVWGSPQKLGISGQIQ